MKLYMRLWLVVCVPLAAVGASLAFVSAPVPVTFLFIYFGAMGMLLTPGFVAEYWESSSGDRMRLLACGAVVGGSAACSFIGFASLVGLSVFLLVLLVLASSPYAVRRYVRWLGAAAWSASVGTLPRVCARARPRYASRPKLDLSTLTDEQLCQLWRASYMALVHSSASEWSATVADRQSYLDEFERRNRSGFATWLASGPLASASPLPYLVGVPTINWDDLTREQDS
jgi:hypothetical protein